MNRHSVENAFQCIFEVEIVVEVIFNLCLVKYDDEIDIAILIEIFCEYGTENI